MGKKALVLGGGGSRGSYQIGVWKALRELGFDFSIVTGTSVGALNGAMITQGEFDLAVTLWQNIKTRDVIDLEISDTIETPADLAGNLGAFLSEMVRSGGTDARPLEELLRKYLDEQRLLDSSTQFGFVTVEFPKLTPRTFVKNQVPAGQMIDYLMASAACFPAMRARVIEEKNYIDGAYYDNLPVELAISMGAEDIVAVDLEATGIVRKVQNSDVRVRTMKSHWDLGVTLLFDPKTTERNMQLGYLDAYKLFGEREGTLYTFYCGEKEKIYKQTVKQSDLLLAKTNLHPTPGHWQPEQVRILRTVEKITEKKAQALDSKELICVASELAGKYLDLSPLLVYRAEEFDAAILEKYHALSQKAGALQELKEIRTMRNMRAAVAKMEGKLVFFHCAQTVSRLMRGEAVQNSVRLLCRVAPEAFLAGAYAALLHERKEREDGGICK